MSIIALWLAMALASLGMVAKFSRDIKVFDVLFILAFSPLMFGAAVIVSTIRFLADSHIFRWNKILWEKK